MIKETSLHRMILLVLISISFNSCITSMLVTKAIQGSKAKKEFTVENQAIPEDFLSNNEVIIGILEGKRSYDKYVKKAFQKNYEGEYLFLSMDQVNTDEKYNKNVEKYRYIFYYSRGTTHSTTWSNGQSSSTTRKRFYVYDRLTEKRYQSGAEFSFFGKAMKVYASNLELERMKNK